MMVMKTAGDRIGDGDSPVHGDVGGDEDDDNGGDRGICDGSSTMASLWSAIRWLPVLMALMRALL